MVALGWRSFRKTMDRLIFSFTCRGSVVGLILNILIMAGKGELYIGRWMGWLSFDASR